MDFELVFTSLNSESPRLSKLPSFDEFSAALLKPPNDVDVKTPDINKLCMWVLNSDKASRFNLTTPDLLS